MTICGANRIGKSLILNELAHGSRRPYAMRSRFIVAMRARATRRRAGCSGQSKCLRRPPAKGRTLALKGCALRAQITSFAWNKNGRGDRALNQ